jgi:spermidine/putrescine transport system permease protein
VSTRSPQRTVERWVEQNGRKAGPLIYGVFLLFLWLPIFVVSFMSFASGEGVLQFPPNELTLRWYTELFSSPEIIDATVTSFKVSAIAVPISVFNATLAAYGLERYAFRGKSFLWLLVLLPLVVPLVVTGTALLQFLNQIGLGSGFVSVVIAHVVRGIPYATLVILPSFLSFDKALEEASMDLGANRIQTFFKVTLPNVMPGIIAGALLVFAISFNEFVYTYFVRDTTTITLPVYIYNKIRLGISPVINVISVLFIVIAVVVILLAVSATNIERVATRE